MLSSTAVCKKAWAYLSINKTEAAICCFWASLNCVPASSTSTRFLARAYLITKLSLRVVNWIKWSLREKYYDEEFISSLYSQLAHLQKNIEYDILGNHLIANSKALIFGGTYLYKSKGKKFLDILLNQ